VMELELGKELRFHFEHQVEKYKQAGSSDDEETRRARLSFGGQAQVAEDCRQARGHWDGRGNRSGPVMGTPVDQPHL
jgi:hypothetical protein